MALCALMLVSGALLVIFSLRREVILIVDGTPVTFNTAALSVNSILKQAKIMVNQDDQVTPPRNHWLFGNATIIITHARNVQIETPTQTHSLKSAQAVPANLLTQAGIALFPNDRILINGTEIPFDAQLPAGKPLVLQFSPAMAVELALPNYARAFYSSAPTLGRAMLENAIALSPYDYLSVDPETPLNQPIFAALRPARQVAVAVGGQTIYGSSAAETVGQALQGLGLALNGMDYSIPPESDPIPEDGNIRLVRVTETVVLKKTENPFESEYQPDPETELDRTSVIQAGVTGLILTRERIRYEDGVETSRSVDAEWQASQPQKAIYGYGTKVVIRTETINGVTIEYWRKISVYATSYSPCRSGVPDKCFDGTSSGLPVDIGVIAVTRAWYSAMKLQPVYVPGYGRAAIGDVGGGIPGTPWIDLAYRDDNWAPWSQWVTIYFLTPVPAYIPYLLP